MPALKALAIKSVPPVAVGGSKDGGAAEAVHGEAQAEGRAEGESRAHREDVGPRLETCVWLGRRANQVRTEPRIFRYFCLFPELKLLHYSKYYDTIVT